MPIFITKKSLTIFILIIIILGGFSVAQNSRAAINKQFNYQGKLTDASGVAVTDGVYDMVFKIYTEAGGTGAAVWTGTWTSAALWTETGTTTITADHIDCGTGYTKIDYLSQTNEGSLQEGQYLWNITQGESATIKSVVAGSDYICIDTPFSSWVTTDDLTNMIYVKDGLFSVMLGSITALPDFTGSQKYYLGVKVGADVNEMIPRKLIGSVPQAWNANNVVGDGYVDIDNTSTVQDAVNINYNPASGTFDAVDITYGSGGGTGNALTVTQSGTGSIVNLVGDAITTGKGMALSADALTSGIALDITSTSAGLTSGSLLNVSSSTTGAVATNGIVSLTALGAYTSTANVGLLTVKANATLTGTIQRIEGNALTSGTALSIASTSTAFTGNLADLTLSGSNAANTGSVLSLTNSGVLNTGTSFYLKHYATGTNNLAFRVDDVSGDTTPFVIDGAGLVGVGTSAPTGILTVRSDSTTNVVSLLRTENLDTAAIGTGGSVDFYANRTSSGTTQYTSLESVVTSIDNTYWSGKLNMKVASNGSLVTMIEVGNPNVVINRPLQVNVAGNTGMSYDLNFLNTGTTQITSEGPLVISAGDANHNENLTITTGSNTVSGYSGISTGSSATTLIDSAAPFTADEWIGGTVTIIGGDGAGQVQKITDNTTTTITVADWTGTDLDVTVANSIYHLAYAKGGDIIANIQNSDIVYGGFKVAGIDDGGYIFRISPDGDVEIGGNGSGGSDLVVKQNIGLTGGILTVSQLAISEAGTPSLSENADQGAVNDDGCSDATAYYYKVTALNDNGETTGSTEATITTSAASGTYTNDDTITISWTAVSGATKYKIHRSVDQDWDAESDDYWVDGKYIVSPTTHYTDDCHDDTASDAPPSANTTGGRIAINTTVDGTGDRRLETLDTGNPQLRLTQTNDSVYADFEVSSLGDLTISLYPSTTGNDIILNNPDGSTGVNLWVCKGTACPTVTLSGGDLVVENKIYLTGDNENMPRHSCPTGWVLVPGNSAFGTEDFCVMKYEAKKDAATKNPSSVAAGTPWIYVSWHEAKSACKRIGAHLMTDAEWMTVARNIEATTINDLDTEDAGLQLATGHSDVADAGGVSNAVASIDAADPVVSGCTLTSDMENALNVYLADSCEIRGDGSNGVDPGDAGDKGFYDTGQDWADGTYVSGAANKAQLRTHVLSNGNVLWDIAGNVWEWTDARCATDANAAWDDNGGWLEWSSTTPNPNLSDYERIVGGSTANTSVNGVGQYYGCTTDGSAFRRGGRWSSTSGAGVFALGLDFAPTSVYTAVGFRCAR